MAHRSYVLPGEDANNLGQCNIIDRWGGNFSFARRQIFPCGHQMYIGDIDIQQANCWNFEITRDNDFSFDLACQCGHPIKELNSAHIVKKESGWVYIL